MSPHHYLCVDIDLKVDLWLYRDSVMESGKPLNLRFSCNIRLYKKTRQICH